VKYCFKIVFIALFASGILLLGSCKEEDPGEFAVDPGLVGNWSNELSGDDLRTFFIQSDGSFSATLNPSGTDGQGTVEGVLIREDNDYIMNNMKEVTGTTEWGGAVWMYNQTVVQIVLSENNTVFTLKCDANPLVELFFGGRYIKQVPDPR